MECVASDAFSGIGEVEADDARADGVARAVAGRLLATSVVLPRIPRTARAEAPIRD